MSTHSKDQPNRGRAQRAPLSAFATCVFGLLFLAGSLTGCGGESAPPPTLEVDESIVPPIPSLPSLDGGDDRPIATIEDEDGNRGEFVSNELWLSTHDEAELDALLDRWNGEVLVAFDPVEYGLEASGLPKQYLVRIDTSVADTSHLAADIQSIDRNATGAHAVSSEQGLGLIAIAAEEANTGTSIGMNWVGSGASYSARRTSEAPAGARFWPGAPYDSNAFEWPTHSIGSTQNIGVAEAWRVLEVAGKLDNKVKLAVLDGGFEPDDDFSEDWEAISNVPFFEPTGRRNLMRCDAGWNCPWHGTQVASAAMALPDNGYGSAGTGGPVAEPVLVFTSGDMFSSISALGLAKVKGAKIANMSYGVPVPTLLAWSVLPFDAATAAYRDSGMLLFAAAGNEGKNVDHTKGAFGIEVETTWYTPCENSGVICVGGIGIETLEIAKDSNYGKEHVDIFAPFSVLVGPDPDHPDNLAQVVSGTSLSSPFVAGIAALVWAAEPSLSADEVEDVLLDTARESPDRKVKRVVNALRAVRSVIGDVAPSIVFDSLEDGDEIPLNAAVYLSATVEDLEDGIPCCTVEWVSNADGPLASGEGVVGFYHTFETPGPQVISITATDSDGLTRVESVLFDVVNTPPTVEISKPAAGETAFANYPFVLRATGFDVNEPEQRLDCDSLVWTSDVASDPFPQTGCTVPVELSSIGMRTISVTGTDPQGESATVSATLDVVPAPPNLPPAVTITSPRAYANVNYGSTITLSGSASDPEGSTPLVYTWTAFWDTNSVILGKSPDIQWRPIDTVPFLDYKDGDIVQVQLRLDVRDPEGNVGSDTVWLRFRVSK